MRRIVLCHVCVSIPDQNDETPYARKFVNVLQNNVRALSISIDRYSTLCPGIRKGKTVIQMTAVDGVSMIERHRDANPCFQGRRRDQQTAPELLPAWVRARRRAGRSLVWLRHRRDLRHHRRAAVEVRVERQSARFHGRERADRDDHRCVRLRTPGRPLRAARCAWNPWRHLFRRLAGLRACLGLGFFPGVPFYRWSGGRGRVGGLAALYRGNLARILPGQDGGHHAVQCCLRDPPGIRVELRHRRDAPRCQRMALDVRSDGRALGTVRIADSAHAAESALASGA